MAIFGISLVFWIAFYQIFYTFTFWARDNTATSWAPETFQPFEPLGVILLSPGARRPLGVAAEARIRAVHAGEDAHRRLLVGAAFSLLGYAGTIGGDAGRVSPLWLISANLLIAVGEIALSPMGMSLVNSLSPPQLRGLMMGGWFASLGIGGYLSGYVGTLLGHHAAQPVLLHGGRHPDRRRRPAQPADAADQANDRASRGVITNLVIWSSGHLVIVVQFGNGAIGQR